MTVAPRPEVAPSVDALVARWVQPGMHLHLASTMARPNALTAALARRFRGTGARFTISTTALHGTAHALAIAGIVERAITCFAGDNYPAPRPNPLYADLLQGRPFVLEQWSILTLVQRLMAGAMHWPYALTTSLGESDLTRDKEGLVFELRDPSGAPAPLRALAPLCPDLTLIHGACADDRGNVVVSPPLGEGAWGALAARRGVIASVERIVSREVIAAQPERVLIPGHRVLGLCEARFGAHPQGLRSGGTGGVPGYQDDYDFMIETAASCARPGGAEAWYDRWIAAAGGHHGYLERLGEERLAALVAMRPLATERAAPVGPPRAGERLLVLAARAIVEWVRERRYTSVLAGIGAAHVATWIAAELLRRDGMEVTVLSELGFVGVDPEPGDIFLFSQRHARRSQHLTGVVEVLGALVAGGRRHCLGVLGAAEVDRHGNINTTRTHDGRFLVGSGGANDIASNTDCIVVATASRRRFVERVGFVTSPGRNVLEVVCQLGRFQRDAAGGLALRRWLPDPAGAASSPQAALDAHVGWPVHPDGVVLEAPISVEERALVRRLDPQGVYG